MLLTAILLGSCAPQVAASPTADVNAIMTESVGTFVAQFFQTQTAMSTPPTPTPLHTPTAIASSTPLALPSVLPSATYIYYTAVVYPSVTATGTQYTPTVNPSTLGYGCNNLGLINDLEVAPGTVMKPGENFTKTWQVANTGTCDWLFSYRLVPVSGTSLAEEPVRLSGNYPVPKGEWRKVTVSMTAPTEPGSYSQYWQLSDGAGHTFGATLAVSIVVKKPTTYP